MSEHPHGTSLHHWPRDLIVACVHAFQHAVLHGQTALDGKRAAERVYLAHGGRAADPYRQALNILQAVQRHDPNWLWKPIRDRRSAWERYWRAQSIEPPSDRRLWPGWPAAPVWIGTRWVVAKAGKRFSVRDLAVKHDGVIVVIDKVRENGARYVCTYLDDNGDGVAGEYEASELLPFDGHG